LPKLIGLDATAARSALRVAGFKIRSTTGAYGQARRARLTRQYPAPLKLAARARSSR